MSKKNDIILILLYTDTIKKLLSNSFAMVR